jgi:4-diphosphocytidyl-2-C-methyl-D-erythritol kinase
VTAPVSLRIRAFAKINLTLRVLGSRPDGYHDVRTTLQTIALYDTLTLTARRGPLRLVTNDADCPADRRNLVWRAAVEIWRAAGRTGQVRDLHIDLVKRVPMQAGLGGGSSDAAAALRGLAALWRVEMSRDRLHAIAARLGADVPFFLEGGTALGVDRGETLFALPDASGQWAAVIVPGFGVTTQDAYGWWDAHKVGHVAQRSNVAQGFSPAAAIPPSEWRNDLQAPVAGRHPEIARAVRSLARAGATYAAMSGSGSAVFGLFGVRAAAASAAGAASAGGARTFVTRTLSRSRYSALAAAQRVWP